jgi:ATP-binding cassette subfamily F protein 3
MGSQAQVKRAAAAERRAALAPLRSRLGTIEARMETLSAAIAKVDAALQDGRAFAEDPARAQQLARMRSDAAAALAKAEEDWLAVSGEIEAAAT